MIIVVNGAPRAGKDSFCRLVEEEMKSNLGSEKYCFTVSTVDGVKEVAKRAGWDGVKDEKSRKFLSDLKKLLTDFNDFPFSDTHAKIDRRAFELVSEGGDITKLLVFVMCREPNEIDRIVRTFRGKALLVSRLEAELVEHKNESDSNIMNYNGYNFIIPNNGTLDDLRGRAKYFVEKFLKGELYDGIY